MASKTRGGKKKFIGHKGGSRHFTDFEELKAQQAEIKDIKERAEVDGEDEEGAKAAEAGPASKSTKPGEKEKSSSESSSSEDEDDDENKRKGIQHLIEIDNPNRIKQKMKKVTDLNIEDATGQNMSRREREAMEKEKARQDYQRLHAQGKTEQAQADLARLQIIKKQREDAAKKREGEKVAKEEAEKAQQTQKLAGVVKTGPTPPPAK